MPQIDTPLLLDVLLGLVILLFVPFGIRRGVAREAMVSAGIFLGATLADRFTPAWSLWLGERFGLSAGTASFLVSAGLLFAGAFLLGYGGGAALGGSRLGVLSRLVGGLLAAFNAALMLSYLLAWVERDVGQGGSLDEGYISPWLLQRTSDLLLAAAGVLLVLTVLSWFVHLFRSRQQPHRNDAYATHAVGTASASPAPVNEKYEPADSIARSGRFAPGLDATTPMPAMPAGSAQWAPANGRLVNGNGHASPVASAQASDETVWSAWDPRSGRDPNSGARVDWPVAQAAGVTPDERCAVCHARDGPRDVFCPECGATL